MTRGRTSVSYDPSGAHGAAATPILDVASLTVSHADDRSRELVKGVGFTLALGESLGIVGESGSGKSLTARAIAGMLPRGLKADGSVTFEGVELLTTSPSHRRSLRGAKISLLMQDPFTMLNPLLTVGSHIRESLSDQTRRGLSRSAVRDEVLRRLREVGISDPSVEKRYPFQLSGGMRQRVAIAAALAKDPDLLIADEPTTALDSTIQKEVLDLLAALRSRRNMSLLLITHDLAVAFSVTQKIVVMRSGEIIEAGPSAVVRHEAIDPYTRTLLASDPSLASVPATGVRAATDPFDAAPPLLRVTDLVKDYQLGGGLAPGRAHTVRALRGVSFDIPHGTSVGLVGESGSGKTSIARSVLGLLTPTSGGIAFDGMELSVYDDLSRPDLRRVRQGIQCVFQDPYTSLNPARTVGWTLEEAIRVGRGAGQVSVRDMLERVSLPPTYANRYPEALSGGERQRVAIARALAVQPDLLICDEPVAALDVSVQSKVLDLLRKTREDLALTMLFISHDLAVVRQVTDQVVVLLDGEIVEQGPTATVLSDPSHEYTKRLVAAALHE